MNVIITPTYIDHFHFIKTYLRSFDKYVIDKLNTKQYFVINKNEDNEFRKVIAGYDDIKIEVLYFEDLLEKNNVKFTPHQLFEKFDKFTYQTLKKLYAILHIPEQECLIIDSESMFINDTIVQELFEKNQLKKSIFFTKLNKRQATADFFYKLVKTHSNILQTPDIWFLEHVNWFFEKRVIEDIVTHLGSPIDIAMNAYNIGLKNKECDIHLFEGLLYYGWIYKNKERYKDYQLCDIDDQLSLLLNERALLKYDRLFYKKFKGQAGRIEFALSLLDNTNIKAFVELYRCNNIQILRCESSTIQTYFYQKNLIDDLGIRILACSQNHCFGLNSEKKIKKLVINDVRIIKHWNNLNLTKYFFKAFANQLIEIVVILLLILKIPFNLFIYFIIRKF